MSRVLTYQSIQTINSRADLHEFVVHHQDRGQLARALRKRGVDTTTGYMNDLSDHPLFEEYKRSCPNAKKANANLLHIPVHPNYQSVTENILSVLWSNRVLRLMFKME